VRTRIARSLLALPLVVPAALVVTAAPAAADVRCNGTIGAVTVDDTVVVPSGGTCTLLGTVVKGDVKVYSSGRLVTERVRVIGNVQAEKATSVVVRAGSFVDGDVQVKQGGGASVLDSTVGGNVQYEENSAALAVERSFVDGDVQAFKNRGGVRVLRNTIDGNLQCKENSPAPTGGENRVSGNKEDQCRRL
jgi:hypothetical protein